MRVELKDSVLNTFRIERDKPVIIDGKWGHSQDLWKASVCTGYYDDGREIRFDIPVYENLFRMIMKRLELEMKLRL